MNSRADAMSYTHRGVPRTIRSDLRHHHHPSSGLGVKTTQESCQYYQKQSAAHIVAVFVKVLRSMRKRARHETDFHYIPTANLCATLSLHIILFDSSKADRQKRRYDDEFVINLLELMVIRVQSPNQRSTRWLS